MKSYNGVAILSRLKLEIEEAPDWCTRGDCRHLQVRIKSRAGAIELHDFYVPAGGDIPNPVANPKFAHKLDFVSEATNWFAARGARPRTVLVGDLNIAPLGKRCLEPQATARRRQPHPDRGRTSARLAAHRLHRRGPLFRPRHRKALHLVELPQPGLARLQPRPPPRPHLGNPRPAPETKALRNPAGRPRLAANVGPCSRNDRVLGRRGGQSRRGLVLDMTG